MPVLLYLKCVVLCCRQNEENWKKKKKTESHEMFAKDALSRSENI